MALLMRILKQPLVVGHILTGLLVGPFVFGLIHSMETFNLFSEIGIAFLLFTVGLNLSPHIVREFGKVSLITGLGQVIFTSIIGYFICVWLGFTPIASFYMGVALAFSSTIIILKLITDKGDLDTLYAKISIGFLLVQDFIAILLLFGIPLIAPGNSSPLLVMLMFIKGLALVALVFTASHYVMPRLYRYLANSQEMLFLFSVAWGIGVAAIFKSFGFSLESGALLAGVALANLPARHEISSRLTPLRDFFIILFFILLGSQMKLIGAGSVIPAALILSLLVLIGNPLILMIIMASLGYRKKTSLQTGFTVAQISEFSLILIVLGMKFGHLDQRVLSVVTLVGLITIFGSTYLILYSDKIYRWLEPYLGIFERKVPTEHYNKNKAHTVVLFGSNRIGYDFMEKFKEHGYTFLVVDHNPETIEKLRQEGVDAEYGDAGDFDFLEALELNGVELAVSTIPDAETNLLINKAIKAHNPGAVVMVVAHRIKDALAHYDEGVDYVILPHFLGGKYASEIMIKLQKDENELSSIKKAHIDYLQFRVSLGHEHPNQSA